MQSVLNLKVKYRESFRPFAPAVPREDLCNWFALDAECWIVTSSVLLEVVSSVAAAERITLPIGALRFANDPVPVVGAVAADIWKRAHPRWLDVVA